MPPASPTSKALDTYYATLAELRAHGVVNENGLRRAFATLLATLGKPVGWTLVEEQSLPGRIRPDGTLQDEFRIPHGYWEAKDSDDDLEVEIRRKSERGYPLNNTLFEDGQRAVLYQGRRRAVEVTMADRVQLEVLLALFFGHTEENIEGFHAAVREFQSRIPDLARSVEQTIAEERGKNQRFAGAFDTFQVICRQAIDPNISADEIEKMLVQHLLTERLFRTVFDDPDFTRRNAIADAIEKVIRTLTWNRSAFLKRLDPFYVAIEEAAQGISEYAEKQAFLNTVYERFFQGYSREQADTHGVVYTPQPIVDFMVASVDALLQREFGKSLSDEGVAILDPATGTGNFIINILRRISRRDLKRKYQRELFANEIMLLPYYIASLNIEHTYQELTGEYAPFEGICFTDTLDLAESQQLSFFAEENTERVERQKAAPITVIIGNPPYNVGQRNENDNNKNRKYSLIDKRLAETYVRDSKATLRNQLYDAYVRFFRWASDRLRERDGIVCFVSNNSFVDQLAFDGMRKQLLQDFTHFYHLDLHGNVRKNPKLSGTTHNVFGIQVGVGITIAIRSPRPGSPHPSPLPGGEGVRSAAGRRLYYYRVPEQWTKGEKLAFLTEKKSVDGIEWQTLAPDQRNTWLTDQLRPEFATFMPMGTKEAKQGVTDAQAIFKSYSNGVKTNRDVQVYSFSEQQLLRQAQQFNEIYNATVDRAKRLPPNVDAETLIDTTDPLIKWTRDLKGSLARRHYSEYSERHIRDTLYRPFTRRKLYFDEFWNEDHYQQYLFFPHEEQEQENVVIVVSDVAYRSPFSALITNKIYDMHLIASTDVFQSFPFYVYDADGGNRRENITDWALGQFQAAYGVGVSKRDIFHYVYGMLHHPAYRERYAENLKRDLPRIPLTPALSHGEREPELPTPALSHGEREPELPTPALSHGEREPELPSPRGRGAGGEGGASSTRQKPPLPLELLQRSRELRRNSTDAEQLLWQLLRDRQVAGAKFRRQHPLSGYILDFYCHEARLTIELDGGGHAEPEQATYDEQRTLRLQEQGIRVLRFWNNELFQNTEGVLEVIWDILTAALTPALSHGEREPELPSPRGRGAGGEGATAIFWRFVAAGARLAELHLGYEGAPEYRLRWLENRDLPFSWRVEKMRLSPDKTQLVVNPSLTLAGIPPECLRYRLGNRSALEWVVDQYQVSIDKRSGIVSDPNRPDDEEYVVRLVGRVISVSIETMQIIDGLPGLRTE